MRWVERILACAALLLATTAWGDVTISAAISLKPVLEKAQPLLEKAAGEKVAFNFGASGTLAGQIRQGAPVDLFISADRANAQKLIADQAADKTTAQTIAGNTLVLVVSVVVDDQRRVPASFADVGKVNKLAVGDPKIVPAGTYAKEVLDHLKLWDNLDKAGKLLTAENVAQVMTLVRRGEAEAGIVYATDAKNEASVKVVATADLAWHSPIEYVSVIVSDTKHREEALKVQREILGEKVQTILHDFGFTPPTPPPPPPLPPAPATITSKPAL